MRRVTLILADGLRPDAVTAGRMPSLCSLGWRYTRAANATTVRPSATVSALASLATGVPPDTHGLVQPGLEFLSGLGRLRPLGRELWRNGFATTVVAGDMSIAARAVTRTLAAAAGVRHLITEGRRARETAAAAAEILGEGDAGLTMIYLADCDRAGHAFGWMSGPYLAAASEVDAAISLVAGAAGDHLLIILADHGGGGVHATEHDEPHPLNDGIPLVLAGPTVRRAMVITRPASLLDVPATILWSLDLPVPSSYEGRVIHEAFEPVEQAIAV